MSSLHIKGKPKNFPLAEVIPACRRLVDAGATIYQKWTCGGCGRRVQGNNPNMIVEMGHCEECGHITDLKKTGCNYTLIGELTPELMRVLR